MDVVLFDYGGFNMRVVVKLSLFTMALAFVNGPAWADSLQETPASVATACDQAAAKLASISYDFSTHYESTSEGRTSHVDVVGHLNRDQQRWQLEYTQHSPDDSDEAKQQNFSQRAFFSDTQFGVWTVGTVNPNVYAHKDPKHLSRLELAHVKIQSDHILSGEAFRLLDLPRTDAAERTFADELKSPNWQWECKSSGGGHTTLIGSFKKKDTAVSLSIKAEFDSACGFFTKIEETLMPAGKLARTIEIVPAQTDADHVWYPAKITDTRYTLGDPNRPYSKIVFGISHVTVPMKTDATAFTVEGMRLPASAEVMYITEAEAAELDKTRPDGD